MSQLISETISDRLLLLTSTLAKTHDRSAGLQQDNHQAHIARSCLMAQELLDVNEQHRLSREVGAFFLHADWNLWAALFRL